MLHKYKWTVLKLREWVAGFILKSVLFIWSVLSLQICGIIRADAKTAILKAKEPHLSVATLELNPSSLKIK